jgi:membrane peptidoglycan carboxypeptidase
MILRILVFVLAAIVSGAVAVAVFAITIAWMLPLVAGIAFVLCAAIAIRIALVLIPTGIAIAAVAITLLVAAFSGALAVGVWKRADNASRFIQSDLRARMPAVYDRGGRFIGAYPAQAFSDFEVDPDLPGRMSVAGRLRSTPTAFRNCALFLEDRNFGHWFAGLGIDFGGLARAALTGHGGGSGFVQMTSRALRRLSPGRDEPIGEKWLRKFLEWTDSPGLVAAFMAPDVEPLDFVASNLRFVIGLKKQVVADRVGDLPAGLEFASQLIFGISVEELKPAQQVLLSAAIWRPVVVAANNDADGLASADKVWTLLLARAQLCAPLLAEDENRPVQEVKAEIAALTPPRINGGRLLFGGTTDVVQDFKIAAHPVRELRYFVGDGGLQIINKELQRAIGPDWRGGVNRVELGIGAPRQINFDRAIERAIAEIEARHRDKLVLRLTGDNEGEDRAQVLAVIADLNGSIRGFFQSGPVGAFDQRRQAGSLAKCIGAVVLGSKDQPGTGYCNRAIPGLHNAGGREGLTSCSQPGAYLAARDVFARSVTLALLNRLSKLNPETVESAIKIFGFSLAPDTPPAAAVAAGYVEAAPRAFLHMMISIGRALAGMSGDVPAPHFIERLASADGEVKSAPSGEALPGDTFAKMLVPGRAFLRDVLGAPLTRGTLASIGDLHQSRNKHIRWHVAKTGTSTVASGLTRDAMIAGAFQTASGEAYAYLVLVGAPEPQRPLGHLNGSHISPLAAAIVNEFVKRSGK